MRFGLFRVCATLALAASLSPAATMKFLTEFGPEALGATGTGSGVFFFDTTAQTLSIEVNWTGLSGVTTVAHIHCCTAVPDVGTIGVAVTPGTLPGFPAGVKSGTYEVMLDLTQDSTYTNGFRGSGTAAEASAKLLDGILAGKAYFNIHSTTFPGGEIRDFLAPVPEPATAGLAGVALLGLAGLARLRRRR